MDKVLEDIEKLKDANREMKYTNGNGSYRFSVFNDYIININM